MAFSVCIVGRPNVGKSTLFNRLTGKRQALVDDTPGVTRDRRKGTASIGPLAFDLFDTAGLEEADKESLQGRMTAQTLRAIEEADAVLMMVDGRAGILPMDKQFANTIRKLHKPVVLLVNKCEGGKAKAALADAYGLGLGDPVAISAEHGEGLSDMYDALAPIIPDEEVLEETDAESPMQIAIVGRPNVGKSTLFNRILGEERTLTGPEAGITRDAIMVETEFEGKKLKLVDTAGMRRKANVTEKIEKLALADTLEAIRYAEVVIWMVDANQPLEKQDNTIASLIEQEGRALVLAVNKWDSVEDKPAYLKAIRQRLEKVLWQASGIAVVPISAETGYNVPKLLKECFKTHAVWNRKIGTGELNRWLSAATESHTPPLVKGRRIKIRYMTQKSIRPPTFILFANISDIPDHYIRYLIGAMRQRFALPGVPIRIKIRTGKNPYAKE